MKVLADIPRRGCLVYLDNILVYVSSFAVALASLWWALQQIAAAGQKLHPDKCCFMRWELEFLGHKVGGEDISTLEDKAIWPTGHPPVSEN